MSFYKYFNKKEEVYIIKLNNFWINYFYSANFSYWWNSGSMALVFLILQIVIVINLAMHYKFILDLKVILEFIIIIFSYIFFWFFNYFDIKFHVHLNVLTFVRKYSTIVKLENKKLSLRDQHPVLFDFFKINKKVYYVDINLTHSEYIEGYTTFWVGKDKKNQDIYLVINDLKIKEINNYQEAIIMADNLKLKYKDFEAALEYDLDQLYYNINFILLNELKSRFGTNDIFSLTDSNKSILDLKINLLSDKKIFQDNLLWSPLTNIVSKTFNNMIDKID